MTDTSACRIEELEHTAEIGVRVRAATPANLFACAGLALGRLAESISSQPGELRTLEVSVDSSDVESLMVDWLSEIVYLQETSGHSFQSIDVTLWSPTHLEARLTGSRSADAPRLHFKGVTYHSLRVEPEGSGWVAEVFFDI